METRSLDPADVARSFDIRTRSFGAMPESAREGWESDARVAIGEGRAVAAYDGTELVGRAVIRPFRQWWGGRDLPMAGMAGVVVAPEHRGRGVGTLLMRGSIERSRDLGYPLSALYPATVPVYRSLGWEIAGAQHRFSMEARLLRDLRGGQVHVREARPADAAAMFDILRRQYAAGRACGPRDFPETELREDLADSSVFGYLADDGFVLYGWEGSDLRVHCLLAGSTETNKSLWATVGSGSSIAKRVHAYLAPDDPVHQLLSETVAAEATQVRWMLRLIDLPAAVAGRGFPAGLEVEVPLEVVDAEVPQNCLAGTLQVSGGKGELAARPGGAADADAVRLDANGIAALYAGTPVSSLLTAGLATGGSAQARALLDAAFAGRSAYLLDYF